MRAAPPPRAYHDVRSLRADVLPVLLADSSLPCPLVLGRAFGKPMTLSIAGILDVSGAHGEFKVRPAAASPRTHL